MARIAHPRPQIRSKVDVGRTFHDEVAERHLTVAPVLTQALEQHGFIFEEQLGPFELEDGTSIDDGP